MTEPESINRVTTLKPLGRIALWTLLPIVFVLMVGAAWYASYVFRPGPHLTIDSVAVTIPKGTSVRGIREILARDGIIHDDIRFLLLAKISGYGRRLQAGEFRLRTGMQPGEVLRELASARSVHYAVTIPEGLRAAEIAKLLGDLGWCDPENFIELVADRSLLEKLGFSHLDSLEGYLFPDTYLLTRDISGAEKIIPLMVQRFTAVWDELTVGLDEEPDQQGTVILASIVEEETGAHEERPLIAGVFHNRLQTGMRLQSDPTVVYGSKKFAAPISKNDLLTPTPYNTYTLSGLPVGPISNPGKEALRAVLYPTPTDHLYFVSKNDGTHQFSKSLIEHNRAVNKYQRKNSDNKGK
ncbi:endolytic transglycosylase MltG [Desulfocastanea catecholica]